MHTSPARLLREFHTAFGRFLEEHPAVPPPEIVAFRQRLLEEEVSELAEAAALPRSPAP